MLTRMIPALAVAYWTSSHSYEFGLHIPTRSPTSRPTSSSPRATTSTASLNWAYVNRTPLVPRHQRLVVRVPVDGPLEVRTDRLPEQRNGRPAVGIGQIHLATPCVGALNAVSHCVREISPRRRAPSAAVGATIRATPHAPSIGVPMMPISARNVPVTVCRPEQATDPERSFCAPRLGRWPVPGRRSARMTCPPPRRSGYAFMDAIGRQRGLMAGAVGRGGKAVLTRGTGR